jgi:ribose 1,5-bisphosphokinase PhnN
VKAETLVVVGPCAVGKTTLVNRLVARGISAQAVAQEHSAVTDLYARHQHGGLVYLTAEWPTIHARRPHSLGRPQYEGERTRLERARRAADLIVHTDGLDAAAVEALVVAWWRNRTVDREFGRTI